MCFDEKWAFLVDFSSFVENFLQNKVLIISHLSHFYKKEPQSLWETKTYSNFCIAILPEKPQEAEKLGASLLSSFSIQVPIFL